MGKDYWSKFWKAAGVRALKTFCQAFVGGIGPAVVMGDVAWMYVLSASVLASLVSVAMSMIAGLPEVKFPVQEDEEDV